MHLAICVGCHEKNLSNGVGATNVCLKGSVQDVNDMEKILLDADCIMKVIIMHAC